MRRRSDRAAPQTVGALYDATLDPEGWDRAWSGVVAAFGGTTGAVVVRGDSGLRAPEIVATPGFSAAARALYLDRFHAEDVWADAASRRPGLRATIDTDFMRRDEVLRSAFWTDFLRPHVGVLHLLAAAVPIDAARVALLGLHRPFAARAYDETDRRAFERLLPHVQRAMQIRARLGDLDLGARAGFSALAELGLGALAVDAAGRIAVATPGAEALVRAGRGDAFERGRVTTVRPADAGRLARAIAEACAGEAGGVLRLEGALGAAPIWVTASPLPTRLRDEDAPEGRPLALVLLRDAAPDGTTGLDDARLKRAFGFTPAEAQVARGLYAGHSVAELAAARGVAVSTLRSQVGALLGKVGGRRQSDLIRALAALAAGEGARPDRPGGPATDLHD